MLSAFDDATDVGAAAATSLAGARADVARKLARAAGDAAAATPAPLPPTVRERHERETGYALAKAEAAFKKMGVKRKGGISKSHWKRGLTKLLGMDLSEAERRWLRSAIDPEASADPGSLISLAAWTAYFQHF